MHPTQVAPKELRNEPSLLGTYHRVILKDIEDLFNKCLLGLGLRYKVRNQTQFVEMCPQLQDVHLF